jgi:hypothetical protein
MQGKNVLLKGYVKLRSFKYHGLKNKKTQEANEPGLFHY